MRQSNKSAMTSLASLLLLAHLALAAAAAPTVKPSLKPTVRPTLSPTLNPSAIPTGLPTDAPTSLPTVPTAFVPDYTKIKTWTYNRDSISTCDGITVPCGGNLYPTCNINAATSMQSPVDLSHALVDETIAVFPVFNTINDGCYSWTQLFNPNDVEIDFTQDDTKCTNNYLLYGNDNWILTNIRFKSPSDHSIGGGYLDGEAQMYHTNSRTGRIAVISILLQSDPAGLSGTNNTFLARIWANGGSVLSSIPGKLAVRSTVNLSPYIDFLPGTLGHYRYIGSLTEPPCTEDISWFVYNDPVRISSFDLNYIRRISGAITPNWLAANGDNNRPPQSRQTSIKVVYTNGLVNEGARLSSSSTSTSSLNGVMAVAITALILSILLFLMFIKLYDKDRMHDGKFYQKQVELHNHEVKNPMVDDCADDSDKDV